VSGFGGNDYFEDSCGSEGRSLGIQGTVFS
jgi:hypothetical protein